MQHPANPLLERRFDMAMDAVHRMRNVFTDAEIEQMPEATKIALTAW